MDISIFDAINSACSMLLGALIIFLKQKYGKGGK